MLTLCCIGAIAAIVVVCVLVLLMIFAVLVFIVMYARERRFVYNALLSEWGHGCESRGTGGRVHRI